MAWMQKLIQRPWTCSTCFLRPPGSLTQGWRQPQWAGPPTAMIIKSMPPQTCLQANLTGVGGVFSVEAPSSHNSSFPRVHKASSVSPLSVKKLESLHRILGSAFSFSESCLRVHPRRGVHQCCIYSHCHEIHTATKYTRTTSHYGTR